MGQVTSGFSQKTPKAQCPNQTRAICKFPDNLNSYQGFFVYDSDWF